MWPAAAGHTSRSGHVLNYPGHWAGLGLVLLRGTVGTTVAIQAWRFISTTDSGLLAAVPAVALIVCGAALTVGLFTPICATLAGLGYALLLVTPLGGIALPPLDYAATVTGLAASAGLALLGPGAYSVDARLFGRREIFIPAAEDTGDTDRPGD